MSLSLSHILHFIIIPSLSSPTLNDEQTLCEKIYTVYVMNPISDASTTTLYLDHMTLLYHTSLFETARQLYTDANIPSQTHTQRISVLWAGSSSQLFPRTDKSSLPLLCLKLCALTVLANQMQGWEGRVNGVNGVNGQKQQCTVDFVHLKKNATVVTSSLIENDSVPVHFHINCCQSQWTEWVILNHINTETVPNHRVCNNAILNVVCRLTGSYKC